MCSWVKVGERSVGPFASMRLETKVVLRKFIPCCAEAMKWGVSLEKERGIAWKLIPSPAERLLAMASIQSAPALRRSQTKLHRETRNAIVRHAHMTRVRP